MSQRISNASNLSFLLSSIFICYFVYSISLSLSLSLRFNGHFPGEPGFIEAKDDVGGGDNWTTVAISRAKIQSNHHHQQTKKLKWYKSLKVKITKFVTATVKGQATSSGTRCDAMSCLGCRTV